MEENIAFIGIGAMGYGMAANIRQKMSPSHTLYINDPNPEACERFKSEHSSSGPVEVITSARDAAREATIVISMVPRPEHVKQVYLDQENGVLAAASEVNFARLLCIDSSTIDPATTWEVGSALTQAGVGTYVDAPVSGGIARAADGGLAFMIGHPSQNPRIHDVISMMGNKDKILWCGPLGSGCAAKICNNYMSGTINVALAESLAIGIKSRVDQNVLYNVIKSSSGQTWMMENHNPVPGLVESAPSSRGYERSFGVSMTVKDLSLGVSAAEEVGAKPSMAQRALETYHAACEDEETKDLDYTSVYKIVNRGKGS